MSTQIQLRRGTAADASTIVFAVGEPFYCTDTKRFGIGDGVTPGGTLFEVDTAAIPGGFVPAFTSLAELQAIVTDDELVTGFAVPGVIGGALVYYRLLADGTGTRPNDYNASTNNRSWHQII